jgi:hypothetical protein
MSPPPPLKKCAARKRTTQQRRAATPMTQPELSHDAEKFFSLCKGSENREKSKISLLIFFPEVHPTFAMQR